MVSKNDISQTKGDSEHEVVGERLNKYLARCGVASRREADEMILQGRITVNEQSVQKLATFVLFGDVVKVDGERLNTPEPLRVWRYHKPMGQITAHRDPQGRKTVFQAVQGQDPTLPRLISVGRLDFNTEGLLLLTNSGTLSHELELPSKGWVRRYKVRVYGKQPQGFIEKLAAGVIIDGIKYGPIQAHEDGRKQGKNVWFTVSLQEGKNREVRKVFEHFGMQVNRLIRIAYGPFQLGNLAKGAFEEIPLRVLKEQLGKLYSKLD